MFRGWPIRANRTNQDHNDVKDQLDEPPKNFHRFRGDQPSTTTIIRKVNKPEVHQENYLLLSRSPRCRLHHCRPTARCRSVIAEDNSVERRTWPILV